MIKVQIGRSGRTGLARISAADIQAELARRLSRVSALERRRDQLEAEVASIRADIEALGESANGAAAPARAGRRRTMPKNKTTLVEALARVLESKTMAVGDAMEAVRSAGYKSNARNFRAVVSIALTTSGKFKRVGRGEYTAK